MAEESLTDSDSAVWIPLSIAAFVISISVATCAYLKRRCCSRGGRTAKKDSSDSSDGLIDSVNNEAQGRSQFGATGTHDPNGPLQSVNVSTSRPTWIADRPRARQALETKHPGKIHIALCGTAKGGKSTLINCLTNDKTARPNTLDRNTETKAHPWEDIVLYELPSTDITRGETAVQYCANNHLDAFDQVIFATGPMVRERDLQIAALVAKVGIPCTFVRTQCDNDLNPPEPYFDAQNARKAKLKEQGVNSFHAEFNKFPTLQHSSLYFVSKIGFSDSADAFELDEKRLLDDLSTAKTLPTVAAATTTIHQTPNDRKKR